MSLRNRRTISLIQILCVLLGALVMLAHSEVMGGRPKRVPGETLRETYRAVRSPFGPFPVLQDPAEYGCLAKTGTAQIKAHTTKQTSRWTEKPGRRAGWVIRHH